MTVQSKSNCYYNNNNNKNNIVCVHYVCVCVCGVLDLSKIYANDKIVL